MKVGGMRNMVGKKVLLSILSTVLIGGVLLVGSKLLARESTVVDATQPATGNEDVIVVYGKGKITIKPDIAYINIGVETFDKNAKEAQDRNKVTMNNVLKKLKSMGIDEKDINTIRYSVGQEMDYLDGNEGALGFKVYNIMRIIVRDIDRVGEVINTAYNEGANNVYGISFDSLNRDDAYKEALQKAIENAQDKAATIADQVGVKIGVPIGIYEGENIYTARENVDLLMDSGAEIAVPVEIGELEIEASVTLEYQY